MASVEKTKASVRPLRYDVPEDDHTLDRGATPRSYSLQRERRDMALMKLLEHNRVSSETADGHIDLEHRSMGETPILFHIETSVVQSLIQNVGTLKDPMAMKEMIEEKVREVMMRVHMDSVLGSAVPCSKNSDDIIIRSGDGKRTSSISRGGGNGLSGEFDGRDGPRHSSDHSSEYGLNIQSVNHELSGKVTTELSDRCHHTNDQWVVMCSGANSSSKDENQNTSGRPDREQLELMFHRLSEEMPNFFEQSHDYGMYSQDLEFDNRLMGVKTKGLAAYKATVQSLKLASTAYLVNAHLELLRLTMQPEDGTIQARWRLKGVPLHSFVLRPLAKKHKYRYFDAFSVFQVGSDGLIHHHRLDKMIPDSDKVKEPSLVTRIGIALGLVRPPAISTNWMTGDPHQG
ncbi:hypothetical protein BSL78_13554 [Apostichopus japonicus]|uniref:Uncharacterized protein n=1 Tax=Stichopus japonicus TaxID=307972 RepID=A0A2G8KNI0_STIJA|nr:hypothetical protein BSL78_13554 [Apostichopus japonicus]